jgi:hypothetical protein
MALKLELVPSKQLADETSKARELAAATSEQVHASAHVMAYGMRALAIGAVVLGFGLVLAALVRGGEVSDGNK